MNPKIITLCQMAYRSGKVAMGSQLIPSIQTKEAKLVCYSSFCGNNRKKKLKDKCSYYDIPILEMDDFDKITKKSIQSLAICNEEIAQAIIEEKKKG